MTWNVNAWRQIYSSWEDATRDAGAPLTDEILFEHVPDTTRSCGFYRPEMDWYRRDRNPYDLSVAPIWQEPLPLKGQLETAHGLLMTLGDPETTARIWLAAFLRSVSGRHTRRSDIVQRSAIDSIYQGLHDYVEWHHLSTTVIAGPSPEDFFRYVLVYEEHKEFDPLSGIAFAALCAPYRAITLSRYRIRVYWPEFSLAHYYKNDEPI